MKRYLIAPGPVAVDPHIMAVMSQPVMHHRSPQFSEILSQVRKDLKYLYQTNNDCLIFASSGTGGMEACVSNLLSPGDKAICVVGGKFGERWSEMCHAFGVEPIDINVEWGHAVDPAQVADALDKHPDAKAVFVQAHETSTGAMHPVDELGKIVAQRDETVLVVDAISALGVYDMKVDEWGLDVVVTGSQKSLSLPPGLAVVSVSEKAWKFAEKAKNSHYYFNFLKERKAMAKDTTAYTSAVSLIIGLAEVLKQIRKMGLENLFAHHRLLSGGVKAAVAEMGLEQFSKAPSDALTIIKAPEGINGQDVVKILREDYGITIAGGQAHLKGKVFRIAHYGYLSQWDMIIVLAAIERALNELGFKVELGSGVAAAQRYFAEHKK